MNFFKQTFLVFATTLISASSFAQDTFSAKTKGSFIASGSMSLNATSSKQTFGEFTSKGNTFSFVAGPKAGYYIIDNLAIGLELEVGISSEKEDDSDSELTSTRIGIGPFARYNFDSGFFGEAGAIIGSTKSVQTFSGGEDEFKSNAFGFRVGGGYSFFLGEHIAIEPALFYVLQTSKPKDTVVDVKTTLSTIAFNIGFTAYF